MSSPTPQLSTAAQRRATALTHPAQLPIISPSILSADFAHMGRDCAHIVALGAEWLHLDVMDGHFAPNLTLGPDMCKGLRRALPNIFLDVHLMVTDPAAYIASFAAGGADMFTFHVEATGPKTAEVITRVRDAGMAVGIAINPPTPAEGAFPYLEAVDMVLVMSVNPGFSGQSFIESMLDKTAAIRARLCPTQRLEMDGGIGPKNAGQVRASGCDVLVAGSALFGVPLDQQADVIRQLRGH